MNAKIFISFLTFLFVPATCWAQNQEVSDSLVYALQEVVVEANQPVTELVGSTLVSIIPGTHLENIGSALDVLAQLPMIKVQDDMVNVIGKDNVEIYIDGRPMRDNEELQLILSSNLKKVELLMAPGAAYESTIGAVLRITTRRNFVKGLSITDQFRLQQRRKWSVTDYLGLAYDTGNWEFFIDGTVNRSNSLVKGTTTNTFVYDGKETVVGGSQNNTCPTTVGVVKAGFNYSVSAQSFGIYYRYNPESGNFNNSGTEWLDEGPVIHREICKHIRSAGHLVSGYYENIFAGKYTLHFDGDFRRSELSDRLSTTYAESMMEAVNSTDERKSLLWATKLYLMFPLWSGDFTVGMQDSYTRTSLDYRMLNSHIGEYIPSSSTAARQVSAALFASWSRTFGKLSMSAGARYEYVDYDFRKDGKADNESSRRYQMLTPDISLSYYFNVDSRISLSYKMATVKPPYSQLTGALNYVGLHEIEGGNPALRDERMSDIQLFGTWRGFMLQSDFVRSIDTYAYVKRLYPVADIQLLMCPVNINVSAFSLYLVWNRNVGCWMPGITTGVYRQWLRLDGTRYEMPIFSYYFDNTFSLPNDWIITVNVSGRSSGDMHTNRFSATPFTMDASVGRTFLDKSLTVKISATDIFNTAHNDWTMDTYGISVVKHQRYDYRGISLNVIYNFQPRKSKYKGSVAAEAEINRL